MHYGWISLGFLAVGGQNDLFSLGFLVLGGSGHPSSAKARLFKTSSELFFGIIVFFGFQGS